MMVTMNDDDDDDDDDAQAQASQSSPLEESSFWEAFHFAVLGITCPDCRVCASRSR